MRVGLTAWVLGVLFPSQRSFSSGGEDAPGHSWRQPRAQGLQPGRATSTPGLPGLDRLDCRPMLREFFAEAPASLQFAALASALAFVLTPLLTVGWPLPAFLLPHERLDLHAHRLADHRLYLLRQAMSMLKTVGGLAWGAHPEVRAALEIPPYGGDPGSFRQGGESPTSLRLAGLRSGRPELTGHGVTLR